MLSQAKTFTHNLLGGALGPLPHKRGPKAPHSMKLKYACICMYGRTQGHTPI